MTAERDGLDAISIGCDLDTGLKLARSLVDIPVVGITETSMLTSCSLGKRFGSVSSNWIDEHQGFFMINGEGLLGKGSPWRLDPWCGQDPQQLRQDRRVFGDYVRPHKAGVFCPGLAK